jgi:hypothetical protein
MEQGFTATVVRIEQQTEEIFLIELESAALKHESPFERISARLSLDQTGASGGEKGQTKGRRRPYHSSASKRGHRPDMVLINRSL